MAPLLQGYLARPQAPPPPLLLSPGGHLLLRRGQHSGLATVERGCWLNQLISLVGGGAEWGLESIHATRPTLQVTHWFLCWVSLQLCSSLSRLILFHGVAWHAGWDAASVSRCVSFD
jgi:hypothetical protein